MNVDNVKSQMRKGMQGCQILKFILFVIKSQLQDILKFGLR